MNIIQIVSDTFRRDFLGCYGNNWIHTENLDRFATKSMVFDKAYIASFPTIPHRRDIFTGRYSFTYSNWIFNGSQPNLPRDEIILSQTLRQAGYTTMIIGDTYHLFRDSHYFDRGFDGWLWIRGQEGDRYITNPSDDSATRNKAYGKRYLQNVSNRRYEEDYFVSQTMTEAMKWLELNYDQHKNFFLHIDTFDPHEPWDPPQWYADMYDPDWNGGDVMGGAYVPGRPTANDLSEEELNHLKALYAGEVTLVDRWVGLLLQKVEDLGLYEDTTIIFTTDHGTYMGEHGFIGKTSRLYEEVAHIPLIVRIPDSAGASQGRNESIIQAADLMPTNLDLAGIDIPSTVQAKSILSLIKGENVTKQEIAVSSIGLSQQQKLPNWITVSTQKWALLAAKYDSDTIQANKGNIESELYDLSEDPNQNLNIYDERAEIAEDLRLKMIKFLRSVGTKEETIKKWER